MKTLVVILVCLLVAVIVLLFVLGVMETTRDAGWCPVSVSGHPELCVQ
jgi:hypothetical protein